MKVIKLDKFIDNKLSMLEEKYLKDKEGFTLEDLRQYERLLKLNYREELQCI